MDPVDETGRPITPSKMEARQSLKDLHDEAWGKDISPFLPPMSFLTEEERMQVCERARATPPGCFVEVGIYKGGSAYHLIDVAKIQDREIFLYDTFEGMKQYNPGKGDTIPMGQINADEAPVREALGEYPHVIKCQFPNTAEMPSKPVAFAHIDCDQYQAIIDSCRVLELMMADGGEMLFDDVPVLEGARHAVKELYPDRIEVVGYGRWVVRF